MRRTGRLLVALLLLGAPSFAATPDAAIPITRFVLPNGLAVMVAEQHRTPAVLHLLWVNTGSADDPRGKSGLSHYLEHMLFKGTDKLSADRYNEAIEALGGEHNAFTNTDVTAFHVLVAKEHLAEAMALESERFLHWHPKDDAYASELKVILEERHMRTDNQPGALLSEAMTASLYRNHPYHWPVIGWQHEMESFTPADVKHWHDAYYQPKNAELLLAGDLTPEEARSLATKYYGAWKNDAAVPPRLWPSEPPRRNSDSLVMRNPAVEQPLWRRYYEAPSVLEGKKDEALPLMLLSVMLGADHTGLLYKSLITEQKKASAVDVDYDGFRRGPEIFSITLAPAPGVTLDQLGAAYGEALKAALAPGKLSDVDLARAKTQLKAEMVFARDGLEGFGMMIAELEMLGLPADYFSRFPAMIDQVSLDRVQQAAGDVLVDRYAVTGYLLPEDRDVATEATGSLKGAGDASVH